MDFNKYVDNKFLKVKELGSKLNSNSSNPDFEYENIKLWIDFMVVPVDSNAVSFIVTGNKNEPSGISTTKADFAVFVEAGKSGSVNVLGYLTIDDLKKIIKSNYTELKSGIDDEYKKMGVYLEVDKIL